MANWKRLKFDGLGTPVDVNMDLVAFMHRAPPATFTTVVFAGGFNQEGEQQHVKVQETPDEIYMAKPLRSFS